MVARIKVSNTLLKAFYYNENKVKAGVATCISAENFPFAKERMTEIQRLGVLQKTTSLRESLKVNTVHISLNFDPSETISQVKMQEIARAYMDKIGFGKQPYLVYQHFDSGHPHLHVVTTKIDLKGKVINTNNIGSNQSEKARKEIEIKFGLVKAEGIKSIPYGLKLAYISKVEYGKSETKKAIAIVLDGVLKQYNYTTLAELNAVLNLYNVTADRGLESSRIFKNSGLLYKVIDNSGNPVGVPIKASLFYQKPTLKFLEERFKVNEKARQPYRARLKNAIDFYFLGSKRPSLEAMISSLKKEGISVVLRHSEQGRLYGLTYIDHTNKCVFNGSSLGKTYSAKGILDRCVLIPEAVRTTLPEQPVAATQNNNPDQRLVPEAAGSGPENLLDLLMQPEHTQNYLPYELSGRKRKKKKRKSK